MLLGLAIYVAGTRQLPPDSIRRLRGTADVPQGADSAAIAAIVLMLLPFTIVYAAAMQAYNLLLVWAQDVMDRDVAGFEVPVTWLLTLRGVNRSHPDQTSPRLEMTRYSLGILFEDTGVSAVDVQNRMADFGIDAFWLSQEPWIVPQPFTPEAGEMWSREDIDYWIDVLAHVIDEAYRDPERVRSAPHNQVVAKLSDRDINDPANWATTWAAWQRKQG